MRVLIDACLPVQLKDRLPLAGVRTTREMGWQNKKNGELLALAQHQFDVLLTSVECSMFVFPHGPFDFSISAFQRFSFSI